MTSNKRYQVFLSSTYNDLKEERQEVISALIKRKCFPIAMEYFPAMNRKSIDYIKDAIKECDFYILIVAGRYGSSRDDNGVSLTEIEFDYAQELKIPTNIYLYDGPPLPSDKIEENDEGKERLRSFIQKLKATELGYATWSNKDNLASEVKDGIEELKSSSSAVGWVRANESYAHTQKDFETKFSISLPQLIESQFAGHLKNKESRDWDKKIQQIITEPKMFRIDIFSYPNTNGYADDTYDMYEDRAPSPAPSEYPRLYCSKNKSLLDIFQPVSDEVCANKVISAGGLEDAIMRVALDNTSMPLSNFFLGEGIASKIIGYMIKIGLLQQDRDIIVLTELGRTLSLYLEQRHSEIIS